MLVADQIVETEKAGETHSQEMTPSHRYFHAESEIPIKTNNYECAELNHNKQQQVGMDFHLLNFHIPTIPPLSGRSHERSSSSPLSPVSGRRETLAISSVSIYWPFDGPSQFPPDLCDH